MLIFLRLLEVHFSGLIGSPRVAGLTIVSIASTNPGCRSTAGLRPPPARRCRPPLSTPSLGFPGLFPSSSRRPWITVF